MYTMVLYLCVLIVFSLRRESLKLILATDPLLRWFCHTLVLAMGHRHATTIERNIHVVAELTECASAFYLLLIQYYPPNGLEVTEFQRSTSLLISVSGQNSG
jgi:hypothetical protein